MGEDDLLCTEKHGESPLQTQACSEQIVGSDLFSCTSTSRARAFSVDEEEAEAADNVHKVGYVEMRGAGQNEGGVSSNSSWQSGDKDSKKVLTNSERGFYGDSSQCTKIDVGRMEGDPTSGRV